MKKFSLYISIIVLISSIFSQSSFAGKIDEKKNLEIKAFIYQNDLYATKKGQEYLIIVNKFIEKSKKNSSTLNLVVEKTNKAIEKNTIKNEIQKSFVEYLNLKATIALINLGENVIDSNGNTIDNNGGIFDINTSNNQNSSIKIKVIVDKRDIFSNWERDVDKIKSLPSLKNASFEVVDFSDSGVFDYLRVNGIQYLPTIIFNTNKIDVSKDPQMLDYDGSIMNSIDTYLIKLPSAGYQYSIGGKFNPFNFANNEGKTILSKDDYNKIIDGAYYQGDLNTRYTWIEYGDIQCPYCAKLSNDLVYDDVRGRITTINYYYQHYSIAGHNNAALGAQIIECASEQKGASTFFGILKRSLREGRSDRDYMYQLADDFSVEREKLNKCIDERRFTQKIENQQKNGEKIFGVDSTPTVIIINNYTLQYEKLVGVKKVNEYLDAIDRLK